MRGDWLFDLSEWHCLFVDQEAYERAIWNYQRLMWKRAAKIRGN